MTWTELRNELRNHTTVRSGNITTNRDRVAYARGVADTLTEGELADLLADAPAFVADTAMSHDHTPDEPTDVIVRAAAAQAISVWLADPEADITGTDPEPGLTWEAFRAKVLADEVVDAADAEVARQQAMYPDEDWHTIATDAANEAATGAEPRLEDWGDLRGLLVDNPAVLVRIFDDENADAMWHTPLRDAIQTAAGFVAYQWLLRALARRRAERDAEGYASEAPFMKSLEREVFEVAEALTAA